MNRTWKASPLGRYGDIICGDCGRVFDTQTDDISIEDQCPADDCPSQDAPLAEKGSE